MRTLWPIVVFACFAAEATAQGTVPSSKPSARRPPPAPPAPPAPPLPSLPSIPRVQVRVARSHLLVVQDVHIPRGEWTGGDLRLCVAFGAPGIPKAFDARLLVVNDRATGPEPDQSGEPIPFERTYRCPSSARSLLGQPQMAGALLNVREEIFQKATASGQRATLRLRSLIDSPAEDAYSGREIVVRLGVVGGAPLTLGELEIASEGLPQAIERAEAKLCGPQADPYPLAIAVPSAPPAHSWAPIRPLAPAAAVRHSTDDLCIRFWTAAPAGTRPPQKPSPTSKK